MAKAPRSYFRILQAAPLYAEGEGNGRFRSKDAHRRLGLVAAAFLLATLVCAERATGDALRAILREGK